MLQCKHITQHQNTIALHGKVVHVCVASQLSLLHRMKNKVSSRQLVVMLWICKMTATTRKRCLPQGSSALIHCMTTVNYSSGSPSSQHAPQPASRFASATPAYQSTFSNPAYTGACLPCHSGSTHLRPFCLVLFSQAICSGILNRNAHPKRGIRRQQVEDLSGLSFAPAMILLGVQHHKILLFVQGQGIQAAVGCW